MLRLIVTLVPVLAVITNITRHSAQTADIAGGLRHETRRASSSDAGRRVSRGPLPSPQLSDEDSAVARVLAEVASSHVVNASVAQ